jgi:hypothetical protein
MFTALKRLSTNPYAIGTVALQAATSVGAGLIQDDAVLIGIGTLGLLLFLALVAASRTVARVGVQVFEGVIVERQQPQLTDDVRAHAPHMKTLAKVT